MDTACVVAHRHRVDSGVAMRLPKHRGHRRRNGARASRMGCNTKKADMRTRSPRCDLENRQFITGCNFLTCCGNWAPDSSCKVGQIFSKLCVYENEQPSQEEIQ